MRANRSIADVTTIKRNKSLVYFDKSPLRNKPNRADGSIISVAAAM